MKVTTIKFRPAVANSDTAVALIWAEGLISEMMGPVSGGNDCGMISAEKELSENARHRNPAQPAQLPQYAGDSGQVKALVLSPAHGPRRRCRNTSLHVVAMVPARKHIS